MIANIADHLRKHNEREWNELMRRVIDFFDGKPDKNPFANIADLESKEWLFKKFENMIKYHFC